ncbi:MAG: flagellar hook-length control protein FliK, partial [Deltaproteobacteria bacterium]|nr:flagellar hook-length control protein FliK [Deltaproteobacteria bacterium]
DSEQAFPQQASAEKAELPVLETLPTVLLNERVIVPIVQNAVHGFKDGVPAIAEQFLPEEASATAHVVVDAVRGTLLARQETGMARMESRPVGAGEMVDVLGKKGGSEFENTGKELNSSLQFESEETTVAPARPSESISVENRSAAATPDRSAGSAANHGSVTDSSPVGKETADGVLVGSKMTGTDHFKPVRQENGTAVGQILQDSKAEGKGESVVRELPSGVTVLNPAQTVTMGRSANLAEAPLLEVSASKRGRISGSDGEARDEKGSEVPVTGESEKLVLKQAGFSAQGSSTMGRDSETGGGNQGFSPATGSSGSFDTVIKGRMEPLSDVPQESEVSELHENILSQVREKLLNQDPTGTASKITMKLNPHELGELQINVRLENQKMTVDITAQNQLVKEALLQNIDQLKDTLMRQNISMERFNVSTGDGGGKAFQQSFREGRQTEHQTPGPFSYPVSGYYQEDSQLSQAAFGDARENSLVDMRF